MRDVSIISEWFPDGKEGGAVVSFLAEPAGTTDSA